MIHHLDSYCVYDLIISFYIIADRGGRNHIDNDK
jgi:hypothetical protein